MTNASVCSKAPGFARHMLSTKDDWFPPGPASGTDPINEPRTRRMPSSGIGFFLGQASTCRELGPDSPHTPASICEAAILGWAIDMSTIQASSSTRDPVAIFYETHSCGTYRLPDKSDAAR